MPHSISAAGLGHRNVILRLFLSCGLLLSGFCATARADEQTDADEAALLVLAPNGPVLAQLRISVARRPYRQWVAEFLSRQLDANHSGALTEAELDTMTERFRSLIGVSSPERMLRLASGSKTATSVPVTVFAAWMQKRIPRAFEVTSQTTGVGTAVRLGSLIDANGDGLVSEEELQSAMRTMRFRDLDDDQTYSIAELLPYRDPRTQNAQLAPDVASLPFVHLTDRESRERAADRILSQYGDGQTVAVHLFRLSPSQQAQTDRLQSETADRDELLAYLADPAAHLRIDIQLSDLANRSQTDVQVDPAARTWCTVKRDEFRDAVLDVDGIPLTIRARGGGMNDRSWERGLLGQNFVMYDADQSQYLDESEFGSLGPILDQTGVDPDFAAADINGDAMVTRQELFAWVDRDLSAARSRIEVSIRQDGKTLFSLMDVNADRRLTMRELQEGLQPLQQYDRNDDRRFAESELGTEYVLTIGLGRSEIRRQSRSPNAMMSAMPGQDATDAILPGLEGLDGPEWFRRMDRNQDGDVSRREFLGTPAMFERVDADADGLLSVDEAEQLDAR